MRCPNCGQDLPEGMRFCGYCGTPLPTLEKEEERKLASVMFVDVVGFTRLSEQKDPEEVSELLDRFYRVVDEVVRRHHGHVDKLIGDAALVLFGVPRALENPPFHALSAALDLVEQVPTLGIQVHIGVHTGEVLVTHMGEGVAVDYTVIGDTVNVAQRLESLAQANEILVSERTWRMVEGLFEGEAAGELTVKGRTRPIRVWVIQGRAGKVLRRGLPRKAPLRGRDRELALLREVMEEGQDALVALVADAGFGKSRLLDDTLAEADLFLAAAPDRAVGGMFRGILDLKGELDEERLFMALLARLEGMERCVVRVEDLHWADDLSLNLLERLVVAFPGNLQVFATARPDGQEALMRLVRAFRVRDGRVEVLELGGLPREALEAMVQDLAPDMPEPLKDTFVDRAQGNPLFLEEMIRTWMEEGREDLPERIEGLVQERVDRLPARLKEMLKTISVLGTRFGRTELAHLEILPEDLAFRRLVQTGWLKEIRGGWAFRNPVVREAVYRMLLRRERKTLHETILQALEQEGAPPEVLAFHAVEARAWEKALQYGLQAAEKLLEVRAIRDLGRVVRWLERALEQGIGDDKTRNAVSYYRAEWLRNMGEPREALELADKLLNVLSPETDLFRRALLLKAELLASTGQTAQAMAMLRASRPALPDARWLRAEATVQLLRGEHLQELAERLDQEVSDRLQKGRLQDVHILALPLLQALRYAGRVGRALEVLADLRRALPEGEMEGLQARLWHEEAELLRLTGQVEEARQAFEKALRRLEGLGDRALLGTVLFDYARLLRHIGETQQARALLERALRVGKSLESFGVQFHAMVNLALNALDEGVLPEAHAWLNDAERMAREANNLRSLGMVLHLRGAIRFLYEGEITPDVKEYLTEALRIAETSEEAPGVAANAVLLGWFHLVSGDASTARTFFLKARSHQGSLSPAARAALCWGMEHLSLSLSCSVPPELVLSEDVDLKAFLPRLWPRFRNLWRQAVWMFVQKKGEGVIPLAREMGRRLGMPSFLLENLPFRTPAG